MPKAKQPQQTSIAKPSDDFMIKDALVQHYADWNHKRLLGDAQACARARQTLLAHALKHGFVSKDDEDAFNMLLIKTKILNGFFDPAFNTECLKIVIHYRPHLSSHKEVMQNPALAHFFFALYQYCDSNHLSFNLLERAHRKLTTRTLAYDSNRLAQFASSSQRLKVFVTELNNKD